MPVIRSAAITIRIIKAPLLPSICEVEAIAKLVEAIRDPRPRARGKTVWPGRAERAADDAGEKMPETPPHKLKAIEKP